MTRVGVLRVGYGAYALAFAALAASAASPGLLLAALAIGFLGGLLLVFSDDDLPKWAGLVLVGYFLVILVAFLLATPITVRRGGSYGIEPPNPALASTVLYYLGSLSPLLLAGSALTAAWERERPARLLLMGAVGGLIVVAVLTVVLVPTGASPDDIKRATSQGNLLQVLLGISALAAAVGAGWSAARPEEFA